MDGRPGDFTRIWPLLSDDQHELLHDIVRSMAAPRARLLLRDRVRGQAHEQALLAYLQLEGNEPSV